MCGIVGAFSKSRENVNVLERRIEEALSSISYRGPDNSGFYSSEKAVLGHVRLSIIDLSEDAHQPMLSNSRDTVITYNGEVYNYKSLVKQFGLDEHDFRSTSDTEVILKGFEQKGTESFGFLNGMFAFTLLDVANNKAYIVRDRLGIKPLYYFHTESDFYFGSEVKAIKALSGIEPDIERRALPAWAYYGCEIGEKTLHAGINKLLPGHYIEIKLADMSFDMKCYWKPEHVMHRNSKPETRETVVNHTRDLLEKAVKSQLVGDVPVGVFLSGGIDSSAITAFASKHYDGKIKTYSVGFDFDKGVNELPKARTVAEKFATEHHEIKVGGYDLADTLIDLVHHHDNPFADAANIPLYLLGKQVRGDVKVVLQGDGGDELFAGYQRYQTLATRKYWQYLVPVLRFIHSFAPKSCAFYRRQRYFNALNNKDDANLMASLLTVEDVSFDPLNVFSKDIRESLKNVDPFESFVSCNKRFEGEDIVQKMLYTDTQIILPEIFLEKVDRSTMAASIEVRVPFLDNDLVDYAMSLPASFKVHGNIKKSLLIDALEGILPHDILHGPKTGFSVPYHYWLKGPLQELFYDKLAEIDSLNDNWLDGVHIKRMMSQHKTGGRDHGFMLWKVLQLMIWLTSSQGKKIS